MDDQRTDRVGGGLRRLRFSLASLLIGMLLVAIGMFAARAFYLSAGSVDETIRRGDIIVRAMNKYSADHGEYPAALSDLCPKYIAEIPAPVWGLCAWIYDRDDKWGRAGHRLTFGVDESKYTGDGDSRWLRYEGPTMGWQMGD